MSEKHDDEFMTEALKEAKKAFDKGEVPIGAVLVEKGRIVARAHNQTEMLRDVTAHAEMIAVTALSASEGIKFLEDYTLYVTLEPCVMCAGALRWARIGRLVYGASDSKGGFTSFSDHILHPKTTVSKGVKETEAIELLQLFFRKRR